MTCSRAPPPSTWTTTTMLCNDRNAIALWSHNQHRRQQREISSDLDTAHHTIENFWMASSCSPRACQTFGSIAPSSSRFDNLPLDVDKKMFRSSSSSSTQCCKIAPKEGRLHIHDHDQPPRSITFVVSPASSSSTHQRTPPRRCPARAGPMPPGARLPNGPMASSRVAMAALYAPESRVHSATEFQRKATVGAASAATRLIARRARSYRAGVVGARSARDKPGRG